MDNIKTLIKDVILKINGNTITDYQTVRMSDLNSSGYFKVNLGPQRTSTLKASRNRMDLSADETNLENHDLSDIVQNSCTFLNDTEYKVNNNTEHNSLNKLDSIDKIDINSKMDTKTASVGSVDSARDRSNVPVMGKNALMVKQSKDRNESAIVHELVIEKFNDILSYQLSRSVNRRSFRFLSNEDLAHNSTNSLPCKINKSHKRGSFKFLLSTDEVNAPTTFDDVTTTSSFMSTRSNTCDESEYDVKKFLNEALGEDFNYVTSSEDYPNTYESKSLLDDHSIGSNEISMLVSKATNDFNSTRKLSLLSTDFDSNDDLYEEKIKLGINIQTEIINQTSKALDFCETTKEFMCGIEQVEAEKILLIACLKKEMLTLKLNRIEYNDTLLNDSAHSGSIEIRDVQFPLKINGFHNNNDQQHEFVNYFLLIMRSGLTIMSSEVVNSTSDCIKFEKVFKFPHLNSDFEVCMTLYCAQVKRPVKTYPHETKYHLNVPERNTCPSPKKLFNKVHKYKVASNAVQYYRPSSFSLWGQSEIRIDDLVKIQQKRLYNTPVSANILGNFFMNIKSNVDINNRLKGFLTIAVKDDGYPIWNRRWCVLEGPIMKYWNYPADENAKNPIEIIDLKNCVVSAISSVDRSFCAKAKTLLLPIRHKQTVKNYLLSTDTINEFVDFKTQINSVLDVLTKWKCMTL